MEKNQKIAKKPLFFLILQIILFSLLIFITISVSLNAQFIVKLDMFVFKIAKFFRCGFINNLMLFFTFFGESMFFIVFFITIFIIFFKKRKIFYPLFIITGLSAIISKILKEIVKRARPVGEFVNNLIIDYEFPTSFSFPSGHTQTSLVFYFILTFILLNNFYKGKHKKIILLCPIIFASLIAISRIMLGVHFFSDILAGAIIAIIIITNYVYFNKNNK